ncbi:TPA: hypothetical protein ACT2UD_004693 [Escherichia coli]
MNNNINVTYNRYRCGRPTLDYESTEKYWKFIKDSIIDVIGRDRINAWASIYRDDDGETFFITYVSIYYGNESILELLESLVGKDLIEII